VLTQLIGGGPQTLLPSLEAVYPWVLALLATALFGGLGVARQILGGSAMRRRRLELGLIVAVIATALTGSVFAAAAVGNELALRDTPAISSRFGPTKVTAEPPRCADPVSLGPSATVALRLRGDVDGRPIGSADFRGARNGTDVSWTADVATEVAIGPFSLVRLDDSTWVRGPRQEWRALGRTPTADDQAMSGVPRSVVSNPGLDLEVLNTALTPGYRTAAEERGLEFVEGARARHCRIALDGPTFAAAFPAAGWMSSRADLHRWRGTLDYWIFLDGQVGQVMAAVNGEAGSLGRAGLQANLYATLTATDRGRAVTIAAPAR